MGSALGALKRVAARIGMTVSEYQDRIKNGEKWCCGCKAWHSRESFGVDRTRSDGLDPTCHQARKDQHKRTYVARPRRSKKGSFFAPTRDGDRIQARSRVNQAVNSGLIPDPNDLPCTDCGHVFGDDMDHEYDHYMGYGAANQLDVQPVCTRCHGKREMGRRKTCKHGHDLSLSKIDKNGHRPCIVCRREKDRKRRSADYWREWRAKQKEKEHG